MTSLLLVAVFGVFQYSDAVDFDSRQALGLDSNQVADGWISLFDGKSLFGWRVESDTNWEVSNRSIRVTKGEVGLLRTAIQFDDFILRLEFKAGPATNSGVFIRSSPAPQDPVSDCYEINIASIKNPFPTGSIVKRQTAKATNRVDGWQRMEVRAEGPRITVWIDGELLVDFEDDHSFLQKGYIGLQHNSGAAQFRNVVVLPLNSKPIFNGRDLDGWNDQKKHASRISVTDESCLRIKGGKGQLETKALFGDFIFTTHARTNAAGVNSGIFFRCEPGEIMNGYESQIQNESVGGDNLNPHDCGTGGIFRRQHARIVNASDQRWFANTIIADGATVGVWINGYQVVDWTDKRKPNSNPRKGLRLQAGTIILQGHDETTDVSFKNIAVRELLPRRK